MGLEGRGRGVVGIEDAAAQARAAETSSGAAAAAQQAPAEAGRRWAPLHVALDLTSRRPRPVADLQPDVGNEDVSLSGPAQRCLLALACLLVCGRCMCRCRLTCGCSLVCHSAASAELHVVEVGWRSHCCKKATMWTCLVIAGAQQCRRRRCSMQQQRAWQGQPLAPLACQGLRRSRSRTGAPRYLLFLVGGSVSACQY